MQNDAIKVMEAKVLELEIENEELREENREMAENLKAAIFQLQMLRNDRTVEVSTPYRLQ